LEVVFFRPVVAPHSPSSAARRAFLADDFAFFEPDLQQRKKKKKKSEKWK
jgi:hypothetical protein